MNIQQIRGDFPVLNSKIIYFDNACMTLKPKQVIDKMLQYYNEYPACAERSHHKLGKRATQEYEDSREIIRKFINARHSKEIIFTKNATEGLNLVANSLNIKVDVIIQTDKEHNSNLIPWQLAAKRRNIKHEIVSSDDGFDMESFKKMLKGRKAIVSMVHTSNLDGTSIPIKEIIKVAHDNDAIVVLDSAQAITHSRIDVKKLDVDFMSFSGHKMLGPTGTGVLYAREDVHKYLDPFIVGGSTVEDSTYDTVKFLDAPEKFEAGLQNYAGFIGLGEAAKYLSKYIDDVESHQYRLNKIITDGLQDTVKILGRADPKLRGGIFSFTANKDSHELAILLDTYANIMVRSGRHCVHSWFNAKNIEGSVRASVYIYNTEEEARLFVDKVKELTK